MSSSKNKSINKSVPTICMWMGKNIEDLSKEELLEVVRHLGREVKEARESHQGTLRMWGMCRKAPV